jgi:hypothetical protein
MIRPGGNKTWQALLRRLQYGLLGVSLLAGTGCSLSRLAAHAASSRPPCETGCPECEAYHCPPVCHHYCRCLDDWVAAHEARKRASTSLQDCFPVKPSRDFRNGYRQAFVDRALGGNGAMPAIPPERYWTTCYRTLGGHQLAQEWFAGYAAGSAQAAAACRYHVNHVAFAVPDTAGPPAPDWTGQSSPLNRADPAWVEARPGSVGP